MGERKNLELLVGLFVLVGCGVIASLVITFGRLGQGLSNYYPLRVEFPNAGGLVKDSDVVLAGARIGFVSEAPKLTGSSYVVEVKLNIHEHIRIPRKSNFLVGSSGLMGDRFVDVVPMPGFDPNDLAQPDELIRGSRGAGIEDLTTKGALVMDQLIAELDEIKKMTSAINHRLLHEENLKNLEESINNLRSTTTALSEGTKRLEPVLTNAGKAVDSAKDLVDSGKELVDSGKALVKKAGDGPGPLGTLLSDRQASEDLKAFLYNLRKSGPLFYKDRPLPPTASQPEPAAPAKKTTR